MGLLSSFKNLFKSKDEATVPTGNLTGPGYNFADWSHLGENLSQNQVLSTNEEIFSVVSRLANTLSSLPIHQYYKYEQSDGSLADLLRLQANPGQSSYEWLSQMETARNVDGNAYAWIERNDLQVPVNLWLLNPNSVTIMRNDTDNSIWYRVDDDENHHFLLSSSDVIHVKHINPVGQSLYGISPIDVLNGSLNFNRKVERFSENEMDKRDMFIMKYGRSISPKNREAAIHDFIQMVHENGGAIVTEQDWNIDRFQSSFNAADLASVESITRTRIANAFNVPLSFLNDGQAKNTVNVEHVMTQFVQTTLVPIVRQYETEFNRKLLTGNQRTRGNYFKFNVNGLMRGDTAARTQYYQMMIRNGIASQNDLRKLEDLPPLKEKSADMTWISKDLYPSENQMKSSMQDSAGQPNPNADQQLKGGETVENSNDGQSQDAKVPDNQAGSKE